MFNENPIINYLLKLWGSAILLAPLIICVINLFRQHESLGKLLGEFLAIVLYGAGLSLPTFFAAYLFYKIFFTRVRPVLALKVILLGILIIGLLTTFYFFSGPQSISLTRMDLGAGVMKLYALCIIALGLKYSVSGQPTLPTTSDF